VSSPNWEGASGGATLNGGARKLETDLGQGQQRATPKKAARGPWKWDRPEIGLEIRKNTPAYGESKTNRDARTTHENQREQIPQGIACPEKNHSWSYQ